MLTESSEIEKSGAASHVVSRWAQSINNWMQGGTEVGDVDDGEESVDNGDAIARARGS